MHEYLTLAGGGMQSALSAFLLYISLVRSNLSYCSQVWAPQSSINHLILVERLQRRAIKHMCQKNTFCLKRKKYP